MKKLATIIPYILLFLLLGGCSQKIEENHLIYFNEFQEFEYPNDWTGGKIENDFALQPTTDKKTFILFQIGNINSTDSLSSIQADILKSLNNEYDITSDKKVDLNGADALEFVIKFKSEGIDYIQRNIIAIKGSKAHIIIYRAKDIHYNEFNSGFDRILKTYRIL